MLSALPPDFWDFALVILLISAPPICIGFVAFFAERNRNVR
jgi:hypothetical protein